jgi:hypothetical protein
LRTRNHVSDVIAMAAQSTLLVGRAAPSSSGASGPFDRCVSSSRSVAWDGGESVVSETLGEPHHPMAG